MGGLMIDALAGVSLFAGLSRTELAPLAAMTVPRNYAAHAIIVSEGARADTLFLILSGRVKVFVGGEAGRDIVLSTLAPGSYFGDMMLDDGLRAASVRPRQP